MTKDRRLGRGLAALLGTPLEEDEIVDGAVETPAVGASAAKASTAAVSSVSAKPAAASTKTGAGRSSAGSSSAKPSSAATSNTSKPVASKPTLSSSGASTASGRSTTTGRSETASAKQVTGSVPLDRSASAKGSSADSSSTRPEKPSAKQPSVKQHSAKQPKSDTSSAVAGEALQLSVYEIDNNPFQPRRKFNEEEIAALAESIREHKQLQPVLVRKVGDRYQLISGERRLRATIHAGLKTIRAEVRQADDRLVAELAIVENLQRKDLDPIEKALSFRRYIDQHKCTQDDLAKRLKIDRSTIANLMRLMELPEKVQAAVQSGGITAGHARALLPLGDDEQQIAFADQIKSEHWSVRETERRVSDRLAQEDGILPSGQGGGRKPKNAQIASIEQQLRLALGTKAEIKQSAKGRGKIVINFSNANEFDRILSLISPQAQKRAA